MVPSLSGWAVVGLVACLSALVIMGFLAVAPGRTRLPLHRRRPGSAQPRSALSTATHVTTSVIDGLIRRRGRSGQGAAALELAGVKMRVQDFALMVIAAALALGALGALVSGPALGLVLGLLVPVGTKLLLGALTRRRRRLFADQLDDSLQLMAGSLRAGHSMLQALASVAREADQPTSDEFARIINESRVGRPLADSLDEAARRMASDDFAWITQAIAINREVGGNLAEVLDGVGHTIRERNQIRRQVVALSAEGKLSAIVLMVLPVGIAGFLLMSNPAYMAKFTASLIGYALIAASVVLLIVGGLWLRKSVQVKF